MQHLEVSGAVRLLASVLYHTHSLEISRFYASTIGFSTNILKYNLVFKISFLSVFF